MVRAPHPALTPYVDDYVGYDHILDVDAVHHGLPSPAATVILAFEEPLDSGWADTPDSSTYWTLAGGLHTRATLIRTHGRQCGIQLGLTPAGARSLLGLPLAALAHAVVDHSEIPTGIPADVHARIATAETWSERFRILDAHLLALARRHDGPPAASEVTEAWRVIVATRGQARIEAVARHVGWSRRHLGEKFGDEVGLTPKQVARVARFDRARRLAATGHSLAEVAGVTGYADQAHLTREWRALAGQTPRQTLADEIAFVQDETGSGT